MSIKPFSYEEKKKKEQEKITFYLFSSIHNFIHQIAYFMYMNPYMKMSHGNPIAVRHLFSNSATDTK